jgi:hypothetical protein
MMIRTTSIYIIKIKILFIRWIPKRTGASKEVTALIPCFRYDVSLKQRDTSFDFSLSDVVLGSLPEQHFLYHKGGVV